MLFAELKIKSLCLNFKVSHNLAYLPNIYIYSIKEWAPIRSSLLLRLLSGSWCSDWIFGLLKYWWIAAAPKSTPTGQPQVTYGTCPLFHNPGIKGLMQAGNASLEPSAWCGLSPVAQLVRCFSSALHIPMGLTLHSFHPCVCSSSFFLFRFLPWLKTWRIMCPS